MMEMTVKMVFLFRMGIFQKMRWEIWMFNFKSCSWYQKKTLKAAVHFNLILLVIVQLCLLKESSIWKYLFFIFFLYQIPHCGQQHLLLMNFHFVIFRSSKYCNVTCHLQYYPLYCRLMFNSLLTALVMLITATNGVIYFLIFVIGGMVSSYASVMWYNIYPNLLQL